MHVLDELPELILESIFECLAEVDWNRKNILALSSCSRTLNRVGARLRLRNVILNIRPREEALQNLTTMFETLSRYGGARHVRRMKITGMKYYGDVTVTPGYMDILWQKLVELLSICTGLKDFIWLTSEDLPRCVLDEVQKCPARPRLHLKTFGDHIVGKQSALHDESSDAYALATSPNLYRLETGHSSGGTRYYDTPVPQNLLDIVAGLSPALREFCIFFDESECLYDVIAEQLTCSEWRTSLKNRRLDPVQVKGHLTKLKFEGKTLTTSILRDWWYSVKFSDLRSLTLGTKLRDTYIELDAFQSLIDIAAQGFLRRICKLSIQSTICRGDGLDSVGQLLVNLTSLESLKITSLSPEMFNPAFDYHSTSLKTLHIGERSARFLYTISSQQIHNLRENCPNIQDLYIAIGRTRNEEDVHLYQMLGSFPHIRTLKLVFLCSFSEQIHNLSGEAESECMRSALRCSALDEELAREIFCVILDANRASQPGTIPTFSRLELQHHDQREYKPVFARMQKLTFQPCLLVRKYADIQSNDALWTEIPLNYHEELYRIVKETVEKRWKDEKENCDIYQDVWKMNWPTPPGAYWLDCWHSFPLCSSMDSDDS